MLRACSMRVSARLALLEPAPSSSALLFEAPGRGREKAGGSVCAPAGGSLVLPGDATVPVAATRLPLASTLLASAVRQQEARFITDCGTYLQASRLW
jgi:hypothetical protein